MYFDASSAQWTSRYVSSINIQQNEKADRFSAVAGSDGTIYVAYLTNAGPTSTDLPSHGGPTIWNTTLTLNQSKRNTESADCILGRLSVVLPSPAAVGDFVWTVYYECIITDRVCGAEAELA